RSLVLRPGTAFVAPPAGSTTRGPSASISVQMQSGVVVTFLIYPVRELSQNAHRCVVMYNRDEVVAARKAAGLAVNLDGREPAPKHSNGSMRFGEDGDDGDLIVRKVSKKRPKLSAVANRALKDAIKNPNKIGAFAKSNYGLSLAVAPVVDLDV